MLPIVIILKEKNTYSIKIMISKNIINYYLFIFYLYSYNLLPM